MRRIKVRRESAITLSLLLGLSLVALSLLLARPPVSRAATTLTVNSTADDGTGTCLRLPQKCTVRDAIMSAVSGDTITFSLPANSAITLTNGELLINKNLTINGPGANLLTVQRSAAAGNFRIFEIASGSNVTISGLTIANGFGNNAEGGGDGIDNDGTLTVANCTISGNSANGSNTIGGGILNTGMLTITNSTISGNSANGIGGGGIYNYAGMLTITNSTISGNSPASSGGGIFNSNGGTVNIINSTISGNSANGSGGGIKNLNGTVNAKNTIIALNTSASGSPDFSGTLTSQGYNLIGNTGDDMTLAGPSTGNQYNVDPKLETDGTGNPLLKNNGGPTQTIALLSGSTAIDKGHSSGSSTDQRGLARPVDSPTIPNFMPGGDGSDIGAYEVQADLLPGCNTINRIVNNNNDSGTDSLRAVIANVCPGSTITFAANVRGAINLTSGELLINKSLTISGPGANLLSVQRSAAPMTSAFRIFNTNFPSNNVAISGLTIANGSAPGANGGAIYNAATLTISYCTISDNSASSSSGGGIYNTGGTLTITNSTISGNMTGNGGGIFNANNTANMTSGTLTITNSTISGNSATSAGGGINSFGTATITNSTISGNSAGSNGGGIFNGGGTLTAVSARNTIVALNTSASGPDVKGALTSQNFNLIGNASGATISPAQFSDQIGVDPKLETDGTGNPLLKNNGGPTQTIALLSGSTAIDKGNSSGSTTDQRGFTRPVGIANVSGGDGSDIGAFEVQPLNTPPTITAAPALSRQQGSAATASTIATVSDAETPPGNLIVTVTATPAGISVTDLVNTNGTITANVAASCSATVGANTIGLQVTDGGGATATANLTVNVTANTFSLSPTSPQNFGAGGSSGFVNVTSTGGCSWTAVSNATWIRIDSGASGPPPSTVGFTVFANIGPARTGTITIAGQTFTVNQDSGCTYTLSPTSQNFASAGGTNSVAITAGAGCAWTAQTNSASFITITSPANGSGNGTVSYSVSANSSAAQRTGTMTIAGQTFTVTQDGLNCSYAIAPTSQSFTASGGTNNSVSVTATAGCAWTASSNDPTWLTINAGASGTGNGTVSYTVAANTGPARTGTLTVAGQTFTVIQDAAAPTPQPPTVLLEEGTNRAVALDSVTFVRGPFPVITFFNFSADHHTRVILFTSNLGLSQPDPSVLTVQASGFTLTVENVGTVSGVPGLDASYIVVRLPDGLPAGDLPLAVTLRGVTSNTATLGISP